MNLEEKNPFIFIISGKARHGKDTVASMIRNAYERIGLNTINLQYSTPIKEYAKKISNWDGSEETKPRELLQLLGTELIRQKIDFLFFVKRMISDIKVYSYFYDIITVSDARAKVELDIPRQELKKVIVINVTRPSLETELTQKEQKHYTETDLDDYTNYDYKIINDGTIEDLEEKVSEIIEDIKRRF